MSRNSQLKAKKILGNDMTELLYEIAPFIGPRMDVFKTKEAFNISVDLAGAERKEISLKLTGKLLLIEGRIQECFQEEDAEWLISERYCGYFSRKVLLPDECVLDRVHAEFGRGILSIRIPFWQQCSKEKL